MNQKAVVSYGIVIVVLLLLTGTASAAVHTLNPGDSIQQNITDAAWGDTLILNPGTYSQNYIDVSKSITIRANTTAGGSATNTIIDGTSSNLIFYAEDGDLTLDNLTLKNGVQSGSGGAIASSGRTVIITSSIITDCSSDGNFGGAIYSQQGGTLTITSSTITNCSAGDGEGGAIYASDLSTTVMITNSTITNCSAGKGGAIYSVINAVITMHFSRVYNNSGTYVVANDGTGSINATHNWWGTNTNPSAKVHGTVTYNPWLVLGVTATPSSITTAQTSVVRANLTYDSGGVYHNPASGHVPDGIPVAFGITSGTGRVLPLAGNMSSGMNTTRFTPDVSGTVMVNATVDGQSVSARISCADSAPTVTGITPSTGQNTTAISITNLSGTNFVTGNTVKLNRTGFTDISGSSVVVVSSTNITTTFDLTNKIAGPYNIVVTNTTTGLEGMLETGFTVTNTTPAVPPTVTGITPSTGTTAGGTSVTINGTGFTGATAVKFGSANAAFYTVDSATRITAKSPAGSAGIIHITITTAFGTSETGASDQFTYTADPTPTPTLAPQPNGGSDDGPAPANARKSPLKETLTTISANVGQIGHTSVIRVEITGIGIKEIIVTASEVQGPGTDILPPPGIIYEYVDISPARFTAITETKIQFVVPQSWLDEHHLTPQEIILYHNTGKTWQPLATTLDIIRNGEAYYTARSDGFSRFAITGQYNSSLSAQETTPPATIQTFGDLVKAPETQSPVVAVSPVNNVPVTTMTSALPAPLLPAPGFPFATIVTAGAAGVMLIGGGFVIRRWWIHRQNPALFREYD